MNDIKRHIYQTWLTAKDRLWVWAWDQARRQVDDQVRGRVYHQATLYVWNPVLVQTAEDQVWNHIVDQLRDED